MGAALGSSVATVRRYRDATQHLELHAARQTRPPLAHEVKPDAFAAYLRKVEVAPNGHPNTERPQLHNLKLEIEVRVTQLMAFVHQVHSGHCTRWEI